MREKDGMAAAPAADRDRSGISDLHDADEDKEGRAALLRRCLELKRAIEVRKGERFNPNPIR